MRIRANLLTQYNNTLFIRIDDANIQTYELKGNYVVLKNNKNEVVGFNIENFDFPKPGKLKITEDLIQKINAIVEEKITHDYNSYLVVGKVLSCKKHPKSDHLTICEVDVKDKLLQIVCGASNVAENQLVVVALENAIVQDRFIKNGELLKEKSEGMLCSAYELELIKEKKKGILILDDRYHVGEEFIWKGEIHV